MKDFKGYGWFNLNNKLILMISDDCKCVPHIAKSCNCDYVICSNKAANKWKESLQDSGAKIVFFS